MIWPSLYNSGDSEALVSPEQQTAVRTFLDGFARHLRQLLTQHGAPHSSAPFLGRMEGWSLYCWVFNDRTTCVLARSSGTPQLLFLREGDEQLRNPDLAAKVVNSQVGGSFVNAERKLIQQCRSKTDPPRCIRLLLGAAATR